MKVARHETKQAREFLSRFGLSPRLAEYKPATGNWKRPPTLPGSINLDAALVEGIVKTYLIKQFDRPQPTPGFHRAMWDIACGPDPKVAIAAPRGHAKSTSITLAYCLAALVTRTNDYVWIIGDTEAQAKGQLGDIKMELLENRPLQVDFGIDAVVKDTETRVICQFKDGKQFCAIARGAGQKLRGMKWRGKRPNLILIDDLENDESVESKVQREKLMDWILNALMPAGSDDCAVRMVGTVLHAAAALVNLMDDPSWTSLRLEAHSPGFKELLWPEKYSKERLEAIRASFMAQGKPEGYAREYLNRAIDETNAYFRAEDLIDNGGKHGRLTYYMSADLAVSLQDTADWSVIAVVGVDEDGVLHVEDIIRDRWDTKQMITQLIDAWAKYRPEFCVIEQGIIDKAIGPFLNDEMRRRRVYMNIEPMVVSKDKQIRARSLQGRLRSGSVRFNKSADWFYETEVELLFFPRGKWNDIVDALANIGLALDALTEAETDQEVEENEYTMMVNQAYEDEGGRNARTGY